METVDLQKQLERWRAETAERPLQSAERVQDRLLDLYGMLGETSVKADVQRWLTLTRERNFFEGKEIDDLLTSIEMELAFGFGSEADMEPAGA